MTTDIKLVKLLIDELRILFSGGRLAGALHFFNIYHMNWGHSDNFRNEPIDFDETF